MDHCVAAHMHEARPSKLLACRQRAIDPSMIRRGPASVWPRGSMASAEPLLADAAAYVYAEQL